MELCLDLSVQISSMILICFIGFLMSRARLVSAAESRILTLVGVYFFGPCAVAGSFQSELNVEQLSGLAMTCGAVLLIHIIIIFSSRLLYKAPLHFTPEERCCAIYSNAGNLAIPMITGIASLGPSYLFYTGGFMAVQICLIWSQGQSLMGSGSKLNVKKIITNPFLIATMVGLVLFFGQIDLPAPIQTTISSGGACFGTTAMLVIGMSLGESDLKAVFGNFRVYVVTFSRLIAFSLVSIVVLYGLGLVWYHPDWFNISVVILISAIGPVATTVAQQAQLFNSDHVAHVSAINLVSTLCCAITMPLMVLLYQWVAVL